MTGYSRSPRLLKGALVAFRPPVPIPARFSFEFGDCARAMNGKWSADAAAMVVEAVRWRKVRRVVFIGDGLKIRRT